jgi:predicted ATP-grasp superfamily ATP-dependent carboligase
MGKPQDKVIVTDGDGLTIIRSLGKRGIGTTLMTQERLVPAMFSRWHSERVFCPSSVNNLEVFVTILQKIARTRRYLTIIPLKETDLLAISERREQLAPYLNIVLPSHESILKALDKAQTLRIAQEMGIPIPETFFARNKAEILKISTRIQYPAVIKPRSSYVLGRNGKANYSRALYVNSPQELISVHAKVNEKFPNPMIQEYVPGDNVSIAFLFDHEQPKAAFSIKVKRSIPVTGGRSVFRESIAPDPVLLKYATNLLKKLHWHGLAQVQFKIDSRDLTPKLMEINPRYWGSMNVAVECGVDFPYMLYQLAKGEQVCRIFKYKLGLKFRWFNGDTENLLSTLNDEPKIKTEQSNKMKAIFQFLKFHEKNLHYDNLTVLDPMPFIFDEAYFAYKMSQIYTKKLIKHRQTEKKLELIS